MDAHKRLIQSAASRWRWLAQCWRLRQAVAEVAQAFSQSPTHVQVAELQSSKADVERQLIWIRGALKDSLDAKAAADDAHEKACADLKVKHDEALRRAQTEEVQAIQNELVQEREAKHLLKTELDDLKAKSLREETEYRAAKDGNRAMLRFLQTRYQLNPK
jgi:hypothetical protein